MIGFGDLVLLRGGRRGGLDKSKRRTTVCGLRSRRLRGSCVLRKVRLLLLPSVVGAQKAGSMRGQLPVSAESLEVLGRGPVAGVVAQRALEAAPRFGGVTVP